MDLINRQDAIDACLDGCCACVNDCVDEIKKLPSAEPEKVCVAEIKVEGEELQRCIDKAVERIKTEVNLEIIRCKDCKHFNDGDCEELPKLVSEDDFCSFAERRTDE